MTCVLSPFWCAATAWCIRRAREPATWAGGGLLGIALQHAFPDAVDPALAQRVIAFLTAGAGLLAVVLREKGIDVEKDQPDEGDHPPARG